MNKDQATGAAKKLGGKMQEEMGKLVGSKHQQTEGIKHQIEGNVQETVGDIKAAVKKVKNAK
ncbi:MAG: CsbD family protein [Undibacterium sp.]|nr:CsbD family protein [Undibacterium sp.]MDO8702203.1 CsbD family protein [Undibacterium sp.]